MSYYLLEVGCEELPAAFVPLAADYFAKETRTRLENLHLSFNEIKSGGTPRRIYLYINGLPHKQADREDIVQGPPAKIAFNPDGTVSEVGIKFAESKGLEISTLAKISTDKGDYLTGIKKIKGLESAELIKTFVSHMVRNIPFPKTMRWGTRDIRFARPLKYLMSIWDGNLLKLDVEDINITDHTAGHRFLAPNSVKVSDYASYTQAMEKLYVVLDIAEREKTILEQLKKIAEKNGYDSDFDPELISTVANLAEYPYAIEGSFDEAFLELPPPVLITSMKNHQKYFPAYKNGKLQAKFIGISNMKPQDDMLIREGYERVLRARLNDAIFFYKNDIGTPLETRAEMLKKVVYQEKLGTSYEKMERFRNIAVWLAKDFAPDMVNIVKEAAELCKADLMCEIVYEFPELQGFMGKVYAEFQGKSSAVANAIEEHYMPRFAGADLPKSVAGRIIAVSDKMDTIAGAFAIGMIPTGSADPYGLRRAAIGIINIIEDSGWDINLNNLIKIAVAQLHDKAKDLEEAEKNVLDFFIQRHKQILLSQGEVETDAYDAAADHFITLKRQKDRAITLTKAKKSEHFNSIAQSYKRINNILKKNTFATGEPNENLFEHDEERVLYRLYSEKESLITDYIKKDMWDSIVEELIHFAEPLAAYFDKVMVNADDENIRNNRLRMLSQIKILFSQVGDLSRII